MDISVSPIGSQCPCQIYDQVQTGIITIGDLDTHPLTPGEEYFVTLRTSSFFGLQNSPTFVVKSLPVDEITEYNYIDGTTARFDIRIAGGVGSYISYKLEDLGFARKLIESGDVPFRLANPIDPNFTEIFGVCCRPRIGVKQ